MAGRGHAQAHTHTRTRWRASSQPFQLQPAIAQLLLFTAASGNGKPARALGGINRLTYINHLFGSCFRVTRLRWVLARESGRRTHAHSPSQPQARPRQHEAHGAVPDRHADRTRVRGGGGHSDRAVRRVHQLYVHASAALARAHTSMPTRTTARVPLPTAIERIAAGDDELAFSTPSYLVQIGGVSRERSTSMVELVQLGYARSQHE